jgi:hypothetical protein
VPGLFQQAEREAMIEELRPWAHDNVRPCPWGMLNGLWPTTYTSVCHMAQGQARTRDKGWPCSMCGGVAVDVVLLTGCKAGMCHMAQG